jgi:hypothetical protein
MMIKKLIAGVGLLLLSLAACALNSPYEGVYTLVTSAARTATLTGADNVNRYVTGVEVICNVTAASGTGGLQVQIQGKDSVSGAYYVVSTTTANTAVGVIRNIIGANVFTVAATTTSVNVNTYVPYTWRIVVVHGDASSYTYSCGYTLYSSS